jgi:Ser/Thr protein kinase RdoA (MazF antagonist)
MEYSQRVKNLAHLDAIANLYGLSVSQLTPISGGHFALVYEYATDDRHYILRITPPDTDVDLPSTRAMLEWLAFLAAHGGPVSRPVRSLEGNLIEMVKYKDQAYIIGAFEKAAGVLAEGMSPADWSDELFQALGNSLGKCHKVAQDYLPVRAEFKRPEWNEAGNCFNPREALGKAESNILEKRARVLAIIQALPKDRENYGLAHLDLHFGNFFVDVAKRRITLFDFDDCAYGWYVMDLAMLLFDVLVVYDGLDKREFGERFLKNLLKGYLTQKQIGSFWVKQLPHFLKLLEIGIYLMLYRSYDPATAYDWISKFMPGRKERIEQEIPYVDLNFEAIFRSSISP